MLVDAELDADTELEVAQVDKRIDRGRGGRRERGRGARGAARGTCEVLRRETRDAGARGVRHRRGSVARGAGAGGSVPSGKDGRSDSIIIKEETRR
jgi:hypothetical protein